MKKSDHVNTQTNWARAIAREISGRPSLGQPYRLASITHKNNTLVIIVKHVCGVADCIPTKASNGQAGVA